ncbi:PepSY-associated TM helix domain-containing protein [Erwinia psidii]|uniref:PepSY domain-containing protein n=1 Tax=Erwinia psidii TaxID=69224 RepID=A0A3N6UVK7_9GAMM|nr:PepSY-associated TM helix domain-containing protein [Erwinia psidii]MCX8959431.1 PepSY domain-containing protein [Erwinia psidii]MCX8962687.1 PepSY domain-containing protein [Erwinia psidii]MCX8964283.1 PepSY domain-containing protein [Erwinia psidii]RQM36885.1 PepSY domain-containing protein [Erwinia psidii]
MSEKILAQPARAVQTRSALMPLLRRLHFYIGLFIAPFIFVAALTGTLYVLTPQLENVLYAQQLHTPVSGPARSLAEQIAVAQKFIGDGVKIAAVRPAPGPGDTTRVMFTTPTSGPSETTAVFIAPDTLQVRGQLTVYGTSGILPFRTWLDYLHRNLLLGDMGRNYSELAASWLWIAAVGGMLLWAGSRTPRQLKTGKKSRGQQILRHRHWHSTLGLLLLLGLIFFSATGLTWSRWAGDNIAAMRACFGWLTPVVNTELNPRQLPASNAMPDMMMSAGEMTEKTPATMEEHAGHRMSQTMPHDQAISVAPAQFDPVLRAARNAGIDAAKIEIRPAWRANKAWTVSEIDRRWPTQVDSVAVDPLRFQVVDKVEFAHFGLLAKLTRWGVDAHMGVLFGLPNQLLLAVFGVGLCVMIVLGYRLWWLRRPRIGQGIHPAETLRYCWQQLSVSARLLLLAITILLAISLPVMGISLLVLLVIDALRWQRAKQRSPV